MRVLVATATAGGGHLAAAAAVEEAWRDLRSADTIERLDVVDYYSALHRRVHAEAYEKLVVRAPELWGLVFNQTDHPGLAARLVGLRRKFTGPSSRRIADHLRRFRPDVALCTHYLPLDVLNRLRERESLAPLTVSVVTDFEPHALWMGPGVDLYCVAAERTKQRLLARGVPAERVAVTGIPIAPKFADAVDAAAVRRRVGLRDDQPVLLVLGGGFGWGPIAEILAGLDTLEARFQIVVVCGRNERLRRDLAVRNPRHPTHLLGFVSNMHELFAASDLVVTKPGGLTTSEALAAGRPMLVVNPIPGQEAANSDFLLEHGAAVKANRVEDVPFRVTESLDAAKLAARARAARTLGVPDSARAVVSAALRRLTSLA